MYCPVQPPDDACQLLKRDILVQQSQPEGTLYRSVKYSMSGGFGSGTQATHSKTQTLDLKVQAKHDRACRIMAMTMWLQEVR
jgi:hypothetical protein